jgi:hypothetical protein
LPGGRTVAERKKDGGSVTKTTGKRGDGEVYVDQRLG